MTWFTILQSLGIMAAMIFAGWQAALTARSISVAHQSSQATTILFLSDRLRDLQAKILNDVDLSPLLTGTDHVTPEIKRKVFVSFVINHFADSFDIRELGFMPDQLWEIYKRDLVDVINKPAFARRWSEIKCYHSEKFTKFVDEMIKNV